MTWLAHFGPGCGSSVLQVVLVLILVANRQRGHWIRVLVRPALVVRYAVESGSVVRDRTSLSAEAAKLLLRLASTMP